MYILSILFHKNCLFFRVLLRNVKINLLKEIKTSFRNYNSCMKEIKIVAPVKKPEDIDLFAGETSCREYYVYYKKFLNNNFDYVDEFVTAAKRNNCAIYINFKHDITEENLAEIKKCLNI